MLLAAMTIPIAELAFVSMALSRATGNHTTPRRPPYGVVGPAGVVVRRV